MSPACIDFSLLPGPGLVYSFRSISTLLQGQALLKGKSQVFDLDGDDESGSQWNCACTYFLQIICFSMYGFPVLT